MAKRRTKAAKVAAVAGGVVSAAQLFDGLRAGVLPFLEAESGKLRAWIREEIEGELQELAERISAAALEGRTADLAILESAGALIVDKGRVRLDALQARAARAAVGAAIRTAFGVAIGLLGSAEPPADAGGADSPA